MSRPQLRRNRSVEVGKSRRVRAEKTLSCAPLPMRLVVPALEGYFRKLKRKTNPLFGSWSRRYFRVKDGELTYHASRESDSCLGKLSLDEITAVRQFDARCFQIEAMARSFFLCASTHQVAQQWVVALQSYCNTRREQLAQLVRMEQALRRPPFDPSEIELLTVQRPTTDPVVRIPSPMDVDQQAELNALIRQIERRSKSCATSTDSCLSSQSMSPVTPFAETEDEALRRHAFSQRPATGGSVTSAFARSLRRRVARGSSRDFVRGHRHRFPWPEQCHIEYLKEHPESASRFNEVYGPNASRRFVLAVDSAYDVVVRKLPLCDDDDEDYFYRSAHREQKS